MFFRAVTLILSVCLLSVFSEVRAQSEVDFTTSHSLEQLFKESGLKSLSKKAVAFSLPDIDGNNVSLNDYKGKVVLLNFWTTWCPNCRKERPFLEKLYQKFKNDDFVILAVNLREPRGLVKKFINKHNLSFLHLLDEKDLVGGKYNVRFLPNSFIINKAGWIVGEAVGLRNWTEKPMIDLFEYLIKE